MDFGNALGISLWNSRKDLEKSFLMLGSPSSLIEYSNALPQNLSAFFNWDHLKEKSMQ
jgi:hypothetical protein